GRSPRSPQHPQNTQLPGPEVSEHNGHLEEIRPRQDVDEALALSMVTFESLQKRVRPPTFSDLIRRSNALYGHHSPEENTEHRQPSPSEALDDLAAKSTPAAQSIQLAVVVQNDSRLPNVPPEPTSSDGPPLPLQDEPAEYDDRSTTQTVVNLSQDAGMPRDLRSPEKPASSGEGDERAGHLAPAAGWVAAGIREQQQPERVEEASDHEGVEQKSPRPESVEPNSPRPSSVAWSLPVPGSESRYAPSITSSVYNPYNPEGRNQQASRPDDIANLSDLEVSEFSGQILSTIQEVPRVAVRRRQEEPRS
ncbi:hypothetical protein CYMTET_13026, partial [Cymbomonas tetramitiformis]